MFGRKSGAPQESTDAASQAASADDRSIAAAPKGRATPSRKEAEAARKERLKPPLDRREAARRERENRTRQRDAMRNGDERALMPRDQGPVRRAVRTFVDSRRNAGELFLPGALLILVLGFIRNIQVQQISLWIWLAMVLLIVIDMFFMLRSMKKSLQAQLPDEDLKGINFYAIMRALQVRPLRMPKCQVKVGGAPVTKR
jgi:hypothetical protein